MLTVVAVVALLGLATVPAFDMELGLPDNSTAPADTPQRQTYDAITATFGEGYNAPLIVTADIITSTSPQDTVSQLADGIRKIPGGGGRAAGDARRGRRHRAGPGHPRGRAEQHRDQ